MIHDCNNNPLWYHKLIRPLIRYKYRGFVVSTWTGKVYPIDYWTKRPWYAALCDWVDKLKSKIQ